MRTHKRLLTLVLSIAALATVLACAVSAQRRNGPPRPPAHRGLVVFIGGYFYDPFFGPYPWWQRGMYPYPYFPMYDSRAEVRVMVRPQNAAVYVDGFYAGIVDDFNGFFERLPLPPGGHEIAIFLDGYRTERHRMYLAPGSTFRLQFDMVPLAPGERSEPPVVAPPLPAPPTGTFSLPHTPPGVSLAPPPATEPADLGTLSLRVQPANADVVIDGERWMSSDGSRFLVTLPVGLHHVVVSKPGYQTFATDVRLADDETTTLNVSLSRPRR